MMNKKCREPSGWDYALYVSSHIGKTSLDTWLNTEEKKPLDNRNLKAEVVVAVLSVGFGIVKSEINRNLCKPINL